MGRLIPPERASSSTDTCGLRHEPPPPPVVPQPSEEEMDLDREIEYAFDADEPFIVRPPAGDIE